MAEVGTAFIEVTPDMDKFGSALSSKVEGESGRMRSIGSSIGRGLGTAIKAGAIAAVAGIGAGIVIGRELIDSASALQETMSRSDAVFKESSQAIRSWAETAAVSFGQSKQEAVDAASTFGNMFVQLGIGTDAAADMSIQMTELASDFASFHNADISQVIEAQTAAFRGEYDAVQRFVPTINAAAVEQKALEMGLAATTKELDAQDKALATQALLMEGAGDAMGDFARTSDSLANQQRIMAARFDDVKASLGERLLPVATTVMGFLLDSFDRVSVAVSAFQSAFSGEGITSDGFVGWMEHLGVVLRDVVGWVQANWPTFRDTIVGVLASIVEFVQAHWPTVQATVQRVMERIAAIVAEVLALVQAIWSRWGDEVLALVTTVFAAVVPVIEGALKTIHGVIRAVTALIRGDWGAAWDAVKQIASGAWATITALISGAIAIVRSVISVGIEGAKQAFGSGIAGIVDFARSLPGRITSAIGDLAGLLVGVGRDIIDGLLRGLNSAWGRVSGWLREKANSIKSAFTDALSIFSPSRVMADIGRNINEGLLVGLEQSWPKVEKQVSVEPARIQSATIDGFADASVGRAPNTYYITAPGETARDIIHEAEVRSLMAEMSAA